MIVEAGTAAIRPVRPSGEQFSIQHGGHQATIAEVGASLRTYTVESLDVVVPFDSWEMAPGFSGAVVLPWANRVADGRYVFDGTQHRVPVNEPERQTALHGFSTCVPWRMVSRASDRVTLRLPIFARPGYPFCVDNVVEYRLSGDGLTVSFAATNVGDVACPFGMAFHPWLSAGGTLVDDCSLRLPASRRVVPDERLLPVGEEDVAGTERDYSSYASLRGTALDAAFTGVARDGDRVARAWLARPDGHVVRVWMDDSFPYWQVCTGDMLPGRYARRGLAVEPMTTAPDGFRSGRDLIRLEPGETFDARWGMTLTASAEQSGAG